ncbi:MAG: LamG-like jellyroll fold domain-containing protein, partial [Bacteroidota bacterium]
FTGPVNVPGSITTYIGRNDDGTTPEDFVGAMDELKLSTIARSSNWIRTEYFNQSDPASFTTVGEEELCPIQLGTVNALDNALAVGGSTTLNLSDYENGVAIQWQQSTDNVSWSDIGGATTDSYTTAALSQTTFYRVQQTATCTVATESVAVAVNGAENFAFRKRITIDGSQVVGDHSNFPLLVRIASDADLAHTGSSGDVQNINGYDIIFTESDGQTPLLHDVEKYVSATGELVAWVGVDLTDQTTRDIFMYYGNASVSAATEVPSGVWDDTYLSVWHLADANDASGNNHHLTSSGGGVTTNDTGIIGGAATFDGAGDFLEESTAQNYLANQLTITVSAWVQPDVLAGDMGILSSRYTVENATAMWYDENGEFGNADQTYKGKVSRSSSGESEAEGEEGTASTNWTHVAMTWSPAAYPTLHIDGRLQVNSATEGGLNSRFLRAQDAIHIGGSFQGDWDGMIDEVKIHGDQRSAGWITTEYNNQRVGSDLLTFGPEETDCEISPTGTLASSRSTVTSGETVSLSIAGYDADVIALQWESSTDGTSFSDVASATTATITSPALSADTYFRVRLNNGTCDAFSEALVVSARRAFIADYSYRKAVTIRSNLVSGSSNLVNFLTFIEITDDNLKSRSNGGNVYEDSGYDLLFTLVDGTVLRYERQEYDAAVGSIRAWVEIPSLSPTADTELYLYYGNCTGLADPSTTAIWSDPGRYRSIHHMEDATDQFDVSGNGFNLTNTGTDVQEGPLGAARDFGGSDRMTFADNIALINNQQVVSTSMWVRPDRIDTDQNLLSISIGGGGGATQTSRFALEYNNDDTDPPRFKLVARADDGDGSEIFAEVATTASAMDRVDQWHHVYAEIDYLSETATLYINGDNVATTSISGAIGWTQTTTENTNSRSSALGAADDGSAPRWGGAMDEVRIMNTALTGDWIRTEYNNQRQSQAFINVDDQEVELRWDGSQSTVWSEPNNWLGCRVPTATEFVRIPATGTDPILDTDASLGDLFIESGASLSLGSNTLSMSGDLTRVGTLTASSGSLSFVGDEDQAISGTTLVTQNLIIDKTNNAVLHLLNNVSVIGQLTLVDGFVALTDGDLTLSNSPAAASASFVITPSDHCLNQNVPNTDVLFPIGVDHNSYSPVILRNSGSADDFCIRVIDGLYEDGYTGAPFVDGVVNKTWLIDEDTDGGSNVTVTLQWRSVDQATGFDANNARITHYNTTLSSWEPFASDPVGGLPSGRFGVSASNVSSFSPVGAASNEVALPIELIFFSAEHQGRDVQLRWATSTEMNNDFFSIERGVNSKEFEVIARVPGQGDSEERVDYEYIDSRPLAGGSYYRLKPTDFDGSFAYSPIEFVFDGVERTPEMVVFPNANDGINFQWNLQGLVPNTQVDIALYDLNGAMITSQTVQLDGSGVYQGQGFTGVVLEPGLYLLKALNNGQELVQRLWVR